LARPAAEIQQRSGARPRRLQRRPRQGPAIRPRSALCGNDFVREARQARVRKRQISCFRKNASCACAARFGCADSCARADRCVFRATDGTASESASIKLLLRRLRILRGILLRIGWVLPRLRAKRILAYWLAQSSSCLQAGLPDSESILRRIPDKFEEAIILGLVVDDDGRLVDLAANTNDFATDNGLRVSRRILQT